MKVRAIATTDERANAIGTVELECTPLGLVIAYLGVGTFSEGYAPGALTMGTRVTVPWSKVDEARLEGEQLFLALDPVLTPLSRLTLVNFSTGQHTHHRELYRQRLILRLGMLALAGVALLVALLGLPRLAPHATAAAALALGGVAALSILVIGLMADRYVALGGRDSDAARGAFSGELAMYLPNMQRQATAPEKPQPKLPPLPALDRLLPRTTAAIVITLSSGILGAILTARWIVSGDRRAEPPPRIAANAAPEPEPAAAEPQAPAAAPAPAPKHSAKPAAPSAPAGDMAGVGAACKCDRADSLLWDQPIAKLSTLLLGEHLSRKDNKKHLTVNVAAVNNSDKEMSDVSFMVQFFDKDPPPSNKTYPSGQRALYFAGPLQPGQAIKWSVEDRGSSFALQNTSGIDGSIGPHGKDAAPTNLLADLLNANHRPVRLHGAMMLAYLGDPRAKAAVLKLRDALRESEAPYLKRILEAVGDVRGCRLHVGKAGATRSVRACIYNTTGEEKSNVAFKVRALDGDVDYENPLARPPMVLAASTFKLPVKLAPHSGVVANAKMSLQGAGQEPAAYEIIADRSDLLR